MREPFWSAAVATDEWLAARDNWLNHIASKCPECCTNHKCDEYKRLERIYNQSCTYEVNTNIKRVG